MKIIVPLAGPDFATPEGVKGRMKIDGQPLLRRAVESRPWWPKGGRSEDLIFVMLDNAITREFHRLDLSLWYPEATAVFVGQSARGAAFSALAGLSMVKDLDEMICIDLADILFDTRFDPEELKAPGAGGVALTFSSDSPNYSYLRTDLDGRFVEAAEKKVISNNASAGVYFFRSASIYLKALAHGMEAGERFTHNGLFYICPLLNGVAAQGLDVLIAPVDTVVDVKTSPARQ